MIGRIVFFTVLLASLASLSSVMAGEPTPAGPEVVDPERKPPGTEERLTVIESRLLLIEQHLRLKYKLPLPDAQNTGTPDLIAPADRIAKLESKSKTINDRLEQLQNQFDELKPEPKPFVPRPVEGRFVIWNGTGVSQYVSVNGMRFYAGPGHTEIEVPYAIVEAYLPGVESPKLLGMSNWRWTGRDYEMRLDITRRF